ncbi:MAG: hypothetical protein QM621_00805 [Aeromicrobium sp.]|uniref:arsenate reductase/protein-tyrosine-phosphatase family protein n=1 Tax=Aeromicrobium sp. TaxID=1871063 RepID=UPI0039E40887
MCTANICRSPVVELLLADRLDSERFEVGSAGVKGWRNRPMDPMSHSELAARGVDGSMFRSREINEPLIGLSGLILTATVDHRAEILALAPTAMRRTFTLKEFAQLAGSLAGEVAGPQELVAAAARNRRRATGDLDIVDPYRADDELYRSVVREIDDLCTVVSGQLNSVGAA